MIYSEGPVGLYSGLYYKHCYSRKLMTTNNKCCGLYYIHDYDHNWWFNKTFMIVNDAPRVALQMEQRALQNVNNYFNINMYSYLELSDGKSSNLYLNVVQFFHTSIN
jgi:hypothetical protein